MKEKEYASLLINIGVNIKKGQTLVLRSPIECADFAKLCTEAAYLAGCREVVMLWTDDYITKLKYLYADDSVFETYPEWQKVFYNGYSAEGAAFLSIYATDPENLKDVSADRIKNSQIAAGKALVDYRQRQMSNDFAWCIASVPTLAWAKKVFPNAKSDAEAIDKLYDAIFTTMRISGNGDSLKLWKEHIEMLEHRKNLLNSYNFKYLKYKNSLGTDLTVELPYNHTWEAGSEKTSVGRDFIANMPTEEIFTLPKKDGINGVVYASRPLVESGNIIDGFHMTVKNGKIVDVFAEKGIEFLKAAISVDEGASYFGEVALVPCNSPISNLGILFYNTLFDENASCHLAFGEAYPCFKDAKELTAEQMEERGLNKSITHVDFMVGTPDLSIIGVTHDGIEINVFVDGNFALK